MHHQHLLHRRGDKRRETRLRLGTGEAATYQIDAGPFLGGGFLPGFDVDGIPAARCGQSVSSTARRYAGEPKR